MESDQNRPQADGEERPPAGRDPGFTGGADDGFKPERPQAQRGAHQTTDADARFAEEPDFSGFNPGIKESLMPRWLHLSLLWVLGMGAVAAVILGARFVTQERKTHQTLELLAESSRTGSEAPATPVAAPVAEKKPANMVFLPTASQAKPAADSRTPTVLDGARTPASSVATRQDVVTARPGPAATAVTKAAPVKAKPIVKKKKPKRKQATGLARRGETRTWPRRRGDSITERLNAAVAACRARPHGPGDCNLRACDILGKDDPACR